MTHRSPHENNMFQNKRIFSTNNQFSCLLFEKDLLMEPMMLDDRLNNNDSDIPSLASTPFNHKGNIRNTRTAVSSNSETFEFKVLLKGIEKNIY